MITTTELQELKDMSARMAVILARVEAVAPVCRTCGHGKGGRCAVFDAEIPQDGLDATCDQWWWDDIPF